MDTRIKFREVTTFFKNVKMDYKSTPSPVTKDEKKKAYKRLTRLLFMNLWNGITAPFIYPIWYFFRKIITKKIYADTTWQTVVKLIDQNKTKQVKDMLQSKGKLLYWLWTYGDLRDPLGEGELTDSGKKNNFWNRFKENAIRNVRFTTNFMEFRTGDIFSISTVIDKRDFTFMHKSDGIGDSPDGIYFKWVQDEKGWGFIYEDNNAQNIFYFGFTGLLQHDLGNNGRFETGYRKTDSSYHKS